MADFDLEMGKIGNLSQTVVPPYTAIPLRPYLLPYPKTGIYRGGGRGAAGGEHQQPNIV